MLVQFLCRHLCGIGGFVIFNLHRTGSITCGCGNPHGVTAVQPKGENAQQFIPCAFCYRNTSVRIYGIYREPINRVARCAHTGIGATCLIGVAYTPLIVGVRRKGNGSNMLISIMRPTDHRCLIDSYRITIGIHCTDCNAVFSQCFIKSACAIDNRDCCHTLSVIIPCFGFGMKRSVNFNANRRSCTVDFQRTGIDIAVASKIGNRHMNLHIITVVQCRIHGNGLCNFCRNVSAIVIRIQRAGLCDICFLLIIGNIIFNRGKAGVIVYVFCSHLHRYIVVIIAVAVCFVRSKGKFWFSAIDNNLNRCA